MSGAQPPGSGAFGNFGFGVGGFGVDPNVAPIVSIPLPQSLNRWRGAVGINWRGFALVGDAFSNVVGLSDFSKATEYGNIQRMLITTPPLHDDRKRLFCQLFEIEVQAGGGTADPDAEPQMMLDISRDGGMTFGPVQRWRSMGKAGQYIKRLRWTRLGNARTWVFRLTCTDPVRRAIIGTYAEIKKGLG